jgi:hypothetical protein
MVSSWTNIHLYALHPVAVSTTPSFLATTLNIARPGINLVLQHCLLVDQRRRVLRLLIHTRLLLMLKDRLDLVAQALALRRVAVATVFLLVHVAFAAATGVEVILMLAQCCLGNEVLREATAVALGSYARRHS